MKTKILISILALLAVGCKQAPDSTTLSGQLLNNDAPFVILESKGLTDTVYMDDDGAFSITLSIDEPTYYNFMAANAYNVIFLRPGSDLHLTQDLSDPAEGLQFEGKPARANSCIFDVNNVFGEFMEGFMPFMQQPREEAFSELDSIRRKAEAVLLEYDINNQHFVDLEKARIAYRVIDFKHQYLNYRPMVLGQERIPSRDGFEFMDDVDFNMSEHLSIPNYVRLLSSDIGHRLWVTNANLGRELSERESEEAFYSLVDSLVTNQLIADYLKYDETVINIAFSDFEQAEWLADFYVANSQTEAYQQAIKDAIAQKMLLASGRPAPNFSVEGLNGEVCSLSDFEGRLIYLDFWASWCGPCISEIPHLVEIKNAYEGKPIAFVAISLDTDKSAWENMLQDKELGGYQLNDDTGWWSEAALNYQIMGVPTFVLIDAEGKIIQYNAPRPSDPELRDLLDKHLAEL